MTRTTCPAIHRRALLRPLATMVCLLGPHAVRGQAFSLDVRADTLSVLTLTTKARTDTWTLPYPTYAFATADVDGDGVTDALVGVVKPTRFDPRPEPRLFVFRNVSGRIRPLWLGSRLCGQLHDFRAAPQTATAHATDILTLERDRHGTWFVGRYAWQSFGFTQTATLITHASRHDAEAVFRNLPRARRYIAGTQRLPSPLPPSHTHYETLTPHRHRSHRTGARHEFMHKPHHRHR